MAGLPVLTTRLDAVVELVERYGAGRTIESMEPKIVADAIVQMLDDKDALARMRANALAACKNELRWNVEAKVLIELYESVFQPASKIGAPLEVRA